MTDRIRICGLTDVDAVGMRTGDCVIVHISHSVPAAARVAAADFLLHALHSAPRAYAVVSLGVGDATRLAASESRWPTIDAASEPVAALPQCVPVDHP